LIVAAKAPGIPLEVASTFSAIERHVEKAATEVLMITAVWRSNKWLPGHRRATILTHRI
jgi:hypothetical protein